MWRFYATGFAFLLAFDTAAQLSFKAAAEAALPMTGDVAWVFRVVSAPWVWIAVAGYVGAFVSYMTLLQRAPIGPAFAAAHVEVVTVSLLAVPLFGERLGWPQLLGGAIILAGIVLLALGEAGEAREAGSGTAADGGPAAPSG